MEQFPKTATDTERRDSFPIDSGLSANAMPATQSDDPQVADGELAPVKSDDLSPQKFQIRAKRDTSDRRSPDLRHEADVQP